MSKFLDICTKISFFAFVMFAPVNWISLINVGSLSIKYMHLAILPIVACLFFQSFRIAVLKFIRQNGFLIAMFMLLMAMDFIATYFNHVVYESAMSYILKNFSYCSYFILFGAVMYLRMKQPSFFKDITYSNTLSVFIFILTASIIFNALGRNFLLDMVNFFIKGDSVSLRYDLYKILFNSDSTGDTELAANLRNTLMGAFIYIHFTSLYANKNLENNFLKGLNIVNIIFSAFFVVASVSRSNILVLVMGYIIYYSGEIFINRNYKKLYQVIAAGVLSFAFVIIFWAKLQTMIVDSSTMIEGRFADLEDDARWDLNAEAINGFSKNFVIGKGSGALLSDGHAVHNFILGSAYQAGFMGLILSVLFYFGIIGSAMRNLVLASKYKGAFLLVSLLCIPLLRSMESGNSGTLSLVEWFCLSTFFAFVMHRQEEAAAEMYFHNSKGVFMIE